MSHLINGFMDEAAVLFDDSINRGQTQARANLLGGEKGLKSMVATAEMSQLGRPG